MDITDCQGCGTRVVPTHDGNCPSCRRSVNGTGGSASGSGCTDPVTVATQPALFVPILIGVLFAIGAVVNFAEHGLVSRNAILDTLLCFGCLQLFIFAKREQHQADEFLAWLVAHRADLQSGTASYRGTEFDRDSEVAQFQLVISLFVVTSRFPSRFYVVGRDSLIPPAVMYTIYSAVFGWWEIPWGPIWTLGAIASNVTGGKRQRIREFFSRLTGDSRNIVRLTPAAAVEARRVIAESRFAPGTVVRVAIIEPTVGDYEIQYDLPINDGRDWQMQSESLTILVDKTEFGDWDDRQISVDFKDGRFTFDREQQRDRAGK